MQGQAAIPVRVVGDDSWRRELCPECGRRLIGLAAWRDHRSRHGWGSRWFAARLHAALPGENVRFNPQLVAGDQSTVEVQAVEDATWKAGIAA